VLHTPSGVVLDALPLAYMREWADDVMARNPDLPVGLLPFDDAASARRFLEAVSA
jgi:hypothetical protein